MQPTRNDFLGILVKRGPSTYNFEISDEYSQAISGFSGDYEYFGYLTTTGRWIIQQHQISTGQYRYSTALVGYSSFLPFSSNLSALGALTFGTYDSIFT